jgi:hypothetical protein
MKKRSLVYLSLIFAFLLGTYRGYVAIWEDGEPVWITQRPVEMLPPADQAALNTGIVVKSTAELNQLLEDYLS